MHAPFRVPHLHHVGHDLTPSEPHEGNGGLLQVLEAPDQHRRCLRVFGYSPEDVGIGLAQIVRGTPKKKRLVLFVALKPPRGIPLYLSVHPHAVALLGRAFSLQPPLIQIMHHRIPALSQVFRS